MKVRTVLFRIGTLVAAALILIVNAQKMPAQVADSEEISKLLIEAKSHAVLAENDAESLESFTYSRRSWQQHGYKLAAIRGHVNDLGKVSKQLVDLRSQGSPWQQAAIDQIDPLLREMAKQLTITMDHLRENQSLVHMPAYRDYAHGCYELAVKTAGMIRDFVEYDKAKSKTEVLEAKLNLQPTENVD
jgi:hypothetical protein